MSGVSHGRPRQLERLPAPFARYCPVALYPATSESEKVSFNQINLHTGHRIKYVKVDADTGDEVANDDIIKGYKVDTDTYIEVSRRSSRTSRWSQPARSTSTSSCRRPTSIPAISSGPTT
ncbi:hypothetical protein GGQ85_003334 [Nitrobacter vulgaris]|nr:hypothetical protein [Nitrobacter vulgaris]